MIVSLWRNYQQDCHKYQLWQCKITHRTEGRDVSERYTCLDKKSKSQQADVAVPSVCVCVCGAQSNSDSQQLKKAEE